MPFPADLRHPGTRQAVRVAALLVALTGIGVLGLRIIEGADWLDCFYMTVITLSTVGYEDPVTLGPAGRLFISLYLIGGFGLFTYSAFTLGQWLTSDDLRRLWERRHMHRGIDRLSGHHVVCGFGRMGRLICEQLDRDGAAFVVVERDGGRLDLCRERGWPHVEGDATDDDVLRRAGLGRAAAIAAVLPSDADNVYVTLSARPLAPAVRIVARASEEAAAHKLRRAGADRVVSPLASGAAKISRFLVDPNMEEFLDVAAGRGEQLELADFGVPAHSPFAGRRLAEIEPRQRGLMVLCIRRRDGTRLVPPPPDAELQPGDQLFLFGPAAAVRRAAEELAPSEAR